MNRKPIELHKIHGTKFDGKKVPVSLPQEIKKRIPIAEWVDDFNGWNKLQFIKETSDYLFDVYGIGDDQNKHTLAMLADQMELYVFCSHEIKIEGLIIFDFGKKTPNTLLAVRQKATTLIIQLMNELGLTPRSRLSGNKDKANSEIGDLLRGPKSA
jgi:phage terminase small subunit